MPLDDKHPASGLPVDRSGGPTVDPTANVIALNDAATKRQDDLRSASDKRQDDLRLAHEKFQEERILHIESIASLRAEHSKELRHMEADRVDKIRSVDVANAAATAAQLLSAVNTLATTAQTTAEVLRNQVAATATAVASQTERALNPILDRIALLEKSSYTGAGKAGVSDPLMAELLIEVKNLSKAGERGTGKGEGSAAMWGYVVGAFGLLLTLIGISSALYAVFRK